MTVTISVPLEGLLQGFRHAAKQLIECGYMARATTFLILTLLVSGCTADRLTESSSDLDISKIYIDSKNKRSNESVEMISRCSGFILSEKEVHAFLTHAARIKDGAPDKYSRILPCSATGTAVINSRKYSWVIRAGGIGEFSAGENKFIAICGKNCCDKVPGIC